MSSPYKILISVQNAASGLSATELIAIHPAIARRTAQRWLRQLVEAENVLVVGRGPARRYYANKMATDTSPAAIKFPDFIPLSRGQTD